MIGLAIVVGILGFLCSLAMLLVFFGALKTVQQPGFMQQFQQHCPACCPHSSDDEDEEEVAQPCGDAAAQSLLAEHAKPLQDSNT